MPSHGQGHLRGDDISLLSFHLRKGSVRASCCAAWGPEYSMRPLLAGCLSILIWLFAPAATFFADAASTAPACAANPPASPRGASGCADVISRNSATCT